MTEQTSPSAGSAAATDPPRTVLTLLETGHERLAGLARGLDARAMRQQSFCTDWSVAQVYSHLGSGAEIGLQALEAAQSGTEPPDRWSTWNRWDALPPEAMIAGFEPADAAYIHRLRDVVQHAGTLIIPIDGQPWPLIVALTARLAEVALHRWDIEVAFDPAAELDAADAAWLLAAFPLDVIAQAVPGDAASALAPRVIDVRIDEPPEALRLELDGATASLRRTPADAGPPDATVRLQRAAQWIRLVAGRWRPGIDVAQHEGHLDGAAIMGLFPGF